MSNDLFTQIEPMELQQSVISGRDALLRQLRALKQIASVTFSNEYEQAGRGKFDKFHANFNVDITDKIKGALQSNGCEITKNSKRDAIFIVWHKNYDRRWIKVDMTTPQRCIVGFTLGLSIAIVVAAFIMM